MDREMDQRRRFWRRIDMAALTALLALIGLNTVVEDRLLLIVSSLVPAAPFFAGFILLSARVFRGTVGVFRAKSDPGDWPWSYAAVRLIAISAAAHVAFSAMFFERLDIAWGGELEIDITTLEAVIWAAMSAIFSYGFFRIALLGMVRFAFGTKAPSA